MNPTPPWLPQGTVYGSLLNFRREYALWAPKMAEPPYNAPPNAPVLYVKTANTFAAHGATIAVPGEVDVGAALGLVKSDLQCFQTLAQAGQARAAIENEASDLQGIAGVVLLVLIVGATISCGTILGYSAMSGAIGGGGLGQIAISYGYNRYQTDVLFVTVALLIVLMQVIQIVGMKISRKTDKRVRN